VRSPTISHANRSHKRDANIAAFQGGQHIAHTAIVDTLRGRAISADCTVSKDDSVYAAHSRDKGVGTGQVSDDEFDLARQFSALVRRAHQGSNRISLTKRLVNDVPPDASSGADGQ
jgi:hypothetical protein